VIPALEIGHRAAALLARRPTGIVIASLRGAVYLLCDNGSVLIAVSPETGGGPLNMVVPDPVLHRFQRGNRFEASPDSFVVGETAMTLIGAPVRVCRPDWRALGRAARTIAQDVSAQDVWREARRELRHAWLKTDYPGLQQALSARGAAVARTATREGSSSLEDAVHEMCGFGPGLTPAGDDWLAGWLYGLRVLDADHAERCARSVMKVARRRTTRLSHAYLECAAAGDADGVWQSFLEAVTRTESDGKAATAIRNALARGASSGVAAVTGYFAALDETAACSASAQEMNTCRL
jgi:hypothetical protein